MPPTEVAALILAAGRGERAGLVAKALLRAGDGATYLERICRTMRAAGVSSGVVVVGPPFHQAVRPAATALGLTVIDNPEPARGMASSVELGAAWAQRAGLSALLLWPCDHPRVAAATVTTLLREVGAHDAAVPVVGERGGHPALVGRALFAALASCASLPQGARSVLRAARVARVAVSDPGCVLDIDDVEAAAAEAARAEAP